jgi:hypothetical protein
VFLTQPDLAASSRRSYTRTLGRMQAAVGGAAWSTGSAAEGIARRFGLAGTGRRPRLGTAVSLHAPVVRGLVRAARLVTSVVRSSAISSPSTVRRHHPLGYPSTARSPRAPAHDPDTLPPAPRALDPLTVDPGGQQRPAQDLSRLELRADRAARVLLAVDVYIVTLRTGRNRALITVALAGTQPLVRNVVPVDNGTTI